MGLNLSGSQIYSSLSYCLIKIDVSEYGIGSKIFRSEKIRNSVFSGRIIIFQFSSFPEIYNQKEFVFDCNNGTKTFIFAHFHFCYISNFYIFRIIFFFDDFFHIPRPFMTERHPIGRRISLRILNLKFQFNLFGTIYEFSRLPKYHLKYDFF